MDLRKCQTPTATPAELGVLPFAIAVGTTIGQTKSKKDGGATASVNIMAIEGKMLDHALHGMTANAKCDVDLHVPDMMADFTFFATYSLLRVTAVRIFFGEI
jgi:hypothetical protein